MDNDCEKYRNTVPLSTGHMGAIFIVNIEKMKAKTIVHQKQITYAIGKLDEVKKGWNIVCMI